MFHVILNFFFIFNKPGGKPPLVWHSQQTGISADSCNPATCGRSISSYKPLATTFKIMSVSTNDCWVSQVLDSRADFGGLSGWCRAVVSTHCSPTQVQSNYEGWCWEYGWFLLLQAGGLQLLTGDQDTMAEVRHLLRSPLCFLQKYYCSCRHKLASAATYWHLELYIFKSSKVVALETGS